MGFYLHLGCSGGGDSSGRSINLGGIVMAPTVSNNISAPFKSLSKAITDSAASGIICNVYTLEGEDLGSITTSSDGSFTISVDLDALKGAEDTGTSWSEPVVLSCANGIQLYAEITVDESSLGSVDMGTATFTTTLSAQAVGDAISGFSGWGASYKDTANAMDMTCLFDAMNYMWNNSDTDGSGIADDTGALREAIMAYLASGASPSDLGYADWVTLINAYLGGSISNANIETIASVASTQLGVDAATIVNMYGDAQQIFGNMNDLFAAQFASDAYGGANICSGLKDGTIDGTAFIAPILAATDLSSFTSTFNNEGLIVHFGFLERCVSAGTCSSIPEKAGSIFGFLNGYAGSYSDIWDGSAFNDTALAGSFLAGASCSGSKLADLVMCGQAMYRTVYTGAGGDWNYFKSGDSLDSKIFGYWGGYFTGQAGTGSFDPDDFDYGSVWSALYGGSRSESTIQEIEDCVNEYVAAGNFDTTSCYEGVQNETFSHPSVATGTYYASSVLIEEGCDFDMGISNIVVTQNDGDTYSIAIYPSAGAIGLDALIFGEANYDQSNSGTISYYGNADNYFAGQFNESTEGYKTFKFTSGHLSDGGACAFNDDQMGHVYYTD